MNTEPTSEKVTLTPDERNALLGLMRGCFPTMQGLRDPERWARKAVELAVLVIEPLIASRIADIRAERDRADHVTDVLIDRAQRIGMSTRVADPNRYEGWTDADWIADAKAIMDSIDGSVAEFVNGHAWALINASEQRSRDGDGDE